MKNKKKKTNLYLREFKLVKIKKNKKIKRGRILQLSEKASKIHGKIQDEGNCDSGIYE